MAPQVIDYKAVIADLEQKRAQINARIDAAIAAMRQVMALEGTGYAVTVDLPLESPSKAGGPYRDTTLIPAALKHLTAVGHPVLNLDLARALEEGGFEHKSKNFANTLNSVLWRRSKTVGDIRKSGRGWELAAGH